jgi:alpha-L-rhamnosidase
MGFRIGACSALLGISLNWALAQERPPTVDPTYGMSIPKRATEAKLSPDATWIWANQVSDDQTIYLRRGFRVTRAPRKATLFVTADNGFTAYFNGQMVGSTPADSSDGNLWQRVQALDVGSRLKPGANVIAIRAHNDNGYAGVLFRLEIDGKPALMSDNTWKASEQAPGGNWTDAAFDDGPWPSATDEGRVGSGPWGDALQGWPAPLSVNPGYLFHLPIPPVKWAYAGDPDGMVWHEATGRMSIDRPATAAAQTSWQVVFDFGKELTGRVLTEGSSPGLVLGTGESTGEVLAKPWTISSNGASPYTALRFAAITVPGPDRRVRLSVVMDHLYYPVRYRGGFDCSDPLLTKVWYTGAYTAHLCMQQDIWDAPKRDRQRWMGDLHVSGEVIDNVFADQFLMERTMSRLRDDAQRGRPAASLPAQHVNGIPGYSYSWIAGLADLYRHIDDKSYLQSQHGALLSMLEFCREDLDDQGVFANKHGSWVYADWSPGFGNDSPLARATTHMFLMKAVKDAVFLLHELGDEPNAAKYAAWGDQLTRAAQAHLVSAGGTFSDRKQENAMAIYSGVATPQQMAKIFESGVFQPETEPTDLVVSPYYGNYVLRAMSIAGHTQEGLDYVRSFWGQMIKDGATTFYETYDPLWDKHNFHSHLQWDEHDNAAAGYHVSLCHGWSAGPTSFLTECVLGVQPTGAGFKTCTISPRLGDLSWVSGVVPTPHGDIKVRAERHASGLTLKVTIPNGVMATVTLPSSISDVDGSQTSFPWIEIGPGSHTVVGS